MTVMLEALPEPVILRVIVVGASGTVVVGAGGSVVVLVVGAGAVAGTVRG